MSEIQDRIDSAVWGARNERGEFDAAANTAIVAREVRQRVPQLFTEQPVTLAQPIRASRTPKQR